ncbi:MAG: ABC transporter ATP-binding protein [Candidatus Methanomethylophilaceae archaeon]|jgi:ABC-2 type transport system ATP-binding protein|nr:ABC transporter ATP-binding protein [Candidatus Methanomethylophilaceae archaeon]
MSDDAIVQVEGLTIRFGDFTAVDDLTFSIKRGEIFGFLGPNGAGKTTTIRAITTIQRPTSGRIVIDGHDSSSDYLAARRCIGIAQQHISLDKDLSVRQNIKYHAMLHKIPKDVMEERVKELSETLGLGEHMDKKIADLSGGWKRKAAIVCSILHDPSVLFLDEPTAGLDTQSRHLLWELVRTLNSHGTTIFLTTHYIEEAESLCDRVAIIDRGKLTAIGTVEELRDMIGKITVDVTEGNKTIPHHFRSREEAKSFAETQGGEFYNIRRTTLEDVFLELSGNTRGKLQ